jgi:UDP-N-acetyl-D-glucosamine dehydrogenase
MVRPDVASVEGPRGSFAGYDCVVIVTDHKVFDYEAMVAEADLIVDTRNAIHARAPHVFKLGAPHPPAAVESAIAR